MFRFDIEDAFQKIGRVSDVWVARKPPGFAFIEMEVNVEAFLNIQRNRTKHLNEHSTFKKYLYFGTFCSSLFQQYSFQDKRDAEDACRELDGTRICGNRVKVVKPQDFISPK